MHRKGHLFEDVISDENLLTAIAEVNASHHWRTHHRPNACTAWVEETKEERVKELQKVIIRGFEPKPPKVSKRWDASARKWRTVSEPAQWPDQYVHHALIQVLQPIFMRQMDYYCCGSIKRRGPHHGRKAIERWMERDPKHTKYVLVGDIRHFYQSLQPGVVMDRMRQLIKDRQTLDLISRVIRDGVLIGAYTSQWFANTVLQPLDRMIRQSGIASHYVRYMDNLTVFGANKRKLRKLKGMIEGWLKAHELRLKDDWQIYRTVGKTHKPQPLGGTRRGVEREKRRMPDAVGYRYGRGYTIPRKHNLLRIKRAIARYRKKRDAGKRMLAGSAHSLISRLGQLSHCNNTALYRMLHNGERIQRELKKIVRQYQRKEQMTWNMFLARRMKSRCSRLKEEPTATSADTTRLNSDTPTK